MPQRNAQLAGPCRYQVDAALIRAARAAYALAVDRHHFIGRCRAEPRIQRTKPASNSRGKYRRSQSSFDWPQIWITAQLSAPDRVAQPDSSSVTSNLKPSLTIYKFHAIALLSFGY